MKKYYKALNIDVFKNFIVGKRNIGSGVRTIDLSNIFTKDSFFVYSYVETGNILSFPTIISQKADELKISTYGGKLYWACFEYSEVNNLGYRCFKIPQQSYEHIIEQPFIGNIHSDAILHNAQILRISYNFQQPFNDSNYAIITYCIGDDNSMSFPIITEAGSSYIEYEGQVNDMYVLIVHSVNGLNITAGRATVNEGEYIIDKGDKTDTILLIQAVDNNGILYFPAVKETATKYKVYCKSGVINYMVLPNYV